VSWNRIILTLITLFTLNISAVTAKELNAVSDDTLIIQGLFFNEYKAYANSREIFAKLYDNTGEKEYLFREVTASLLSRTYIQNSIERLKSWDSKNPNTLEARRLFIPLYLTNKQIKEAKIEAQFLIEESNTAEDLDLAANPYMYSGDFEKALSLLDKAYAKTSNENVLFRIVTIMDEYTKQRKKAIQLLETHRRLNVVVSNQIYFKLLDLYIKENNIDGILDIYKILYENDKEDKYLDKIIEAYAFKKDFDGAITFLEKNGASDNLLYELYKSKKDFVNSLTLLEKLYKKDKKPKWLAEKAILTYEKAKDKNDKTMIKNVLKYFDEAIEKGIDDSIYLNYYGYTLIDKNIDVKKGMKIVTKALAQQPDNTYYLDSLAWGYYRQNECKKAYEIMKKVVDKEGLEEPEIAQHWSDIKKCNK
jgi:tetratricopeptide (TPR) repeat protein